MSTKDLKHEDENTNMSSEDLKTWSETFYDINLLTNFAKLKGEILAKCSIMPAAYPN